VETCPRDGQVVFDDLARDAAQDVNAELEPLRVYPVGEGLESGAIAR